jgi:hypothetical protein
MVVRDPRFGPTGRDNKQNVVLTWSTSQNDLNNINFQNKMSTLKPSGIPVSGAPYDSAADARKPPGRGARVSFKRTAPRSDGKLELEAGESLLHVVRTLEDGFPAMVSESGSGDRERGGRGSVKQRTSSKLSLFRCCNKECKH